MVDLKAFTAPLFFTIGPFNDIIELFKHIDWVKDSKNVVLNPTISTRIERWIMTRSYSATWL